MRVENPYAAAQRFLQSNDLSLNYVDQIVQFIEKNTAGVKLGGETEDFVDPFTGVCSMLSGVLKGWWAHGYCIKVRQDTGRVNQPRLLELERSTRTLSQVLLGMLPLGHKPAYRHWRMCPNRRQMQRESFQWYDLYFCSTNND